MASPGALTLALAGGAVAGVLTAFPYVGTAIAYRHRDNGLAYIMFVMSVGVWNGMAGAQLLAAEPAVDEYFFALASVGALLAALGWFLFAATASSTPSVPAPRVAYTAASVLVGLDITLLVTAPVHDLYWALPADAGVETAVAFATVVPSPGYWAHLLVLVGLFGAGTALFVAAWREGVVVAYTRAYSVCGLATVVALVGSHLAAPGGTTAAAVVAVTLTTVGWRQASSGGVAAAIRR
jgi:hypothetical protein